MGGDGDLLLLQSRLEAAEKLKAEREGEAIASKKRAAELEAGAYAFVGGGWSCACVEGYGFWVLTTTTPATPAMKCLPVSFPPG